MLAWAAVVHIFAFCWLLAYCEAVLSGGIRSLVRGGLCRCSVAFCLPAGTGLYIMDEFFDPAVALDAAALFAFPMRSKEIMVRTGVWTSVSAWCIR